jgi:hypothetical protein
VVRNVNLLTVYINGQQAGNNLTVPAGFDSIATANDFIIGGGFTGMIADVRAWSHARTQSDLQGYMNTRLSGDEYGLVGNWRLDDLSGVSVPNTVTGGAAGTATSTIFRSAVKPLVYDDAIQTREDTETRGGLLAIDHDPDGTLTATVVQQAAHGTVTLSGMNYAYMPNEHFFGSDSFVVGFNDGSGNLTYATIGVQVRQAQQAPVVSGAAAYTTDSSGSQVLGLTVTDPVGDLGYQKFQLDLTAAHGTITLATTGGLTFLSGTTNGSSHIVVSGTLDRINATLATASYTADSGWSGSTDSLAVNVRNISADSSTGHILVSDTVLPITIANRAPSVTSGALAAAIDGATVAGSFAALDPELATLTFGTVSGTGNVPAHGNLTLDTSSGAYSFAATDANFTGIDHFKWSVTAGGQTVEHTERVEIYGSQTALSGVTTTLAADAGLVNAGNSTLFHGSGVDTLGGLNLASSSLWVSGGTVTINVGASVDSGSTLGIGSGGVVTMAADGIMTSAGTLSLTGGGTISGTGTVSLTAGTLSASGMGNVFGAAFQNAAATLLLVDSFTASEITFQHALTNYGTLDLRSENADAWSNIFVEGVLTNYGTLMASGVSGAHEDGVIATSLSNHGVIQVNHDLGLSLVGSLDNTGRIILGGSTLSVWSDDATSTPAFDNHGNIQGSGTLDVTQAAFTNHGYLSPGTTGVAGTLNIVGDMTLTDDSHIVLDICPDGVGNGDSDRISVAGHMELDGILHFSVTARPTIPMEVLHWTSYGGSFDSITGLDNASGGWLLDPLFNSTGLTLTARDATVIGSNAFFSDTGITANYVIGSGSNEIVHLGGGADVFYGKGGSNIVGISDDDFHFINGGSGGNNQLWWEGTDFNKAFDMTQLQTNALQKFDVLDLSHASNGSAILDLAHILSMTDGVNAVTGKAHELVVIGADNGSVSFADQGWQATGQVDLVVNGQQDSYTQYSKNDTSVLVSSDTHVS